MAGVKSPSKTIVLVWMDHFDGDAVCVYHKGACSRFKILWPGVVLGVLEPGDTHLWNFVNPLTVDFDDTLNILIKGIHAEQVVREDEEWPE